MIPMGEDQMLALFDFHESLVLLFLKASSPLMRQWGWDQMDGLITLTHRHCWSPKAIRVCTECSTVFHGVIWAVCWCSQLLTIHAEMKERMFARFFRGRFERWKELGLRKSTASTERCDHAAPFPVRGQLTAFPGRHSLFPHRRTSAREGGSGSRSCRLRQRSTCGTLPGW